MRYDFDQVIDRSGNLSAKYDERLQKFGRDDVIPLWVADMDFRTAQPIIDALKARAEEGLWGYRPARQLFRSHPGLAGPPEWLDPGHGPHEFLPGGGPNPQRHGAALHPPGGAMS